MNAETSALLAQLQRLRGEYTEVREERDIATRELAEQVAVTQELREENERLRKAGHRSVGHVIVDNDDITKSAEDHVGGLTKLPPYKKPRSS